MNLDRFNSEGWTAQFTLELIKNQEEAERFFREGEALYAKLKKERSALGSLEDAKIADELSAKKLQEAAEILEQANKAAASTIEEADAEIRAKESGLDERKRSLDFLETALEQQRKNLNKDIRKFETSSRERMAQLEKDFKDLDKQTELLERRQNKCRRVLDLAEQITKIKL